MAIDRHKAVAEVWWKMWDVLANGFRCEAALRHHPDVVEQGRDSWWLGGRTREGSIGSSRISRMVPYTKEAESLADHGNPFHFGPFGR